MPFWINLKWADFRIWYMVLTDTYLKQPRVSVGGGRVGAVYVYHVTDTVVTRATGFCVKVKANAFVGMTVTEGDKLDERGGQPGL